MTDQPKRIDAYLVAGGKFHDIDFARVELLKLLAEHPHVRVKVGSDFADTESIAASEFVITYTCDVRPTAEQQEAIADYISGGGRMYALHGTNSALERTDEGVAAPDVFPKFAEVLGSRFLAHPPIAPYTVKVTDADHPLVAGIEEFDTDDELYCCEFGDPDAIQTLLHTNFSGEARGFVVSDWSHTDQHPVMYLRPYGEGAVLYNNLGHCRGHWDMTFFGVDYYPNIERGSWEFPQYYELLRRGIRWAMGESVS